MAETIVPLEKHPLIWRGMQTPSAVPRLPTGHAVFDKHLLGGLPASGLIRIQTPVGIGELSLLKGAILSGRAHKLRVFINVPGDIHAPWLSDNGFDQTEVLQITPENDTDALWAAEQCLKSAVCHCVILWVSELSHKQARRIQVAASDNDCFCLLFQSQHIVSGLPLALDVKISSHEHGLCVDIVKLQGGRPVEKLIIPLRHTPDNSAILRLTQQSQSLNSHLSSVS